MAETQSRLVFDLTEISAKAEILRGTSDRLVSKVLRTRAVNLGLNGEQFTTILRDNNTYWRGSLLKAKQSYMWGVALGIQGRDASLALEEGFLDKPRMDFGELQLIGYLSRLEAVEIEHITDDGIETQYAYGTTEDCLRTSLTLEQDVNHIQAYGSGPIIYRSPPVSYTLV